MNTGFILILLVESLYASSSAAFVRPQFCLLKKVTGPCRASMPSYYYDESQGKCMPFIYGGCDGNKNRFRTLEECQKQCDKEKSCLRPCPMIYSPVCGSNGKTYSSPCDLDVADCLSDEKITKNYDGKCKKCPEFCTLEYDPQCGSDGKTYANPCLMNIATCKSNGKITQEHEGDCASSSFVRPQFCSLKKVSGPCLAYIPSYYYDESQGKCLLFIYGGCGGNKNRFQTPEECQKQCDGGRW